MVTPKSSNLCKMYRKQPKTSQKWLVFGCFLVEVAGLELAASSTRNWRATNCATPRNGEKMRFSVSGQTCGQTEDLRNFRQSGVPKKSVFSRGFGIFQNFRFEIGGLHPKLARYQLRYTSKCSCFVIISNSIIFVNRLENKKGEILFFSLQSPLFMWARLGRNNGVICRGK